MLAKTSTIACVVLGTLFAARAHAQPEPDSETKPPDAAAGADGADQLTLQKGRAVLNAFLGIGLSTDAAFKPVSLSPDVWYGVTDDITAGLVHSAVGTSGFIGGVGTSLCLTGASSGCPDFYRNVGFEGRYRLKVGTGPIALAASGGLYFAHLIDPTVVSLKLGAVGRWHQGPLAVEASPNLFIGLTNRSSSTSGGITIAGNSDVLDLPATALYAVTPVITVAAQTGFVLPLENTGDAYSIPLSIGGFYHVNEQLTASLAFSLPRLVGGGSGNGIDVRSLTLGGSYAF